MHKILILTASIGSGHIKAAEAIETELRRLLPDAEITTVDFMARRISRIHWFMKEFYLAMLAFVPNLSTSSTNSQAAPRAARSSRMPLLGS